VAAELLPADIVGRPKHGFNLPMHTWIRADLRDAFEATLRGSALTDLGILDRAALGRLLDGHLRGETEASRPLWTVFCLLRWWEHLRRAPDAARHTDASSGTAHVRHPS
jgi:asparagine synthase (glutamine-hydrolysing)